MSLHNALRFSKYSYTQLVAVDIVFPSSKDGTYRTKLFLLVAKYIMPPRGFNETDEERCRVDMHSSAHVLHIIREYVGTFCKRIPHSFLDHPLATLYYTGCNHFYFQEPPS